MTYEELLICERELRRAGYTRLYRFAGDNYSWSLRARKHDPMSREGLLEEPIELLEAADLARYIQPNEA